MQIMKLAIYHSDAVICESENVNEELLQFCKDNNKEILPYQGNEEYAEKYSAFYDSLLG
jgi:starch synthase